MSGDQKETPAVSPALLELLVCPETYQPLEPAPAELLERLNAAIARGEVTNRAGEKLDAPLQAGLLRQDRQLLYVVSDEIPIMLPDEAIPVGG
jgi:uncharacterized protein YbaR (Trm112 family)